MMKSQLFIEGINGGRSTKGKTNGPWRSIDYDGVLPNVTIATEHGAVIVTISEDGRSVNVSLKEWKLNDKAPKAGTNRTLYDGLFGPA